MADILVVGAYAFKTIARKEKAEILGISIRDIMDQHRKEESNDVDPKTLLPEQYHDLIEAFSAKEANTLPLKRGGLDDHSINTI